MTNLKKLILLMLIFLLSIAGHTEKLGNLVEPGQPEMMAIHQGKLYLVDGVNVFIYNLPDLKPLGRFGKEGDGPGEFRLDLNNRLQIQIDRGRILLNNRRKMAWFSLSGQLLKEKRFPFLVIQVVPLKDHFVITKFTAGNRGNNLLSVVLASSQLETVKNLYVRPDLDYRRSRKLDIPNELILVKKIKNRVFVMDQKKSFSILVFDETGNPLPAIHRRFPPFKMTVQFKEEFYRWFDSQRSRFPAYASRMGLNMDQMKKMFNFLPHLPVIRFLSVEGERLMVETYFKKNNLSKFYLLSKKGKTVDEIYLPDSEPGVVKMTPTVSYTFNNNRYYYLVESEKGDSWELHRLKIL